MGGQGWSRRDSDKGDKKPCGYILHEMFIPLAAWSDRKRWNEEVAWGYEPVRKEEAANGERERPRSTVFKATKTGMQLLQFHV